MFGDLRIETVCGSDALESIMIDGASMSAGPTGGASAGPNAAPAILNQVPVETRAVASQGSASATLPYSFGIADVFVFGVALIIVACGLWLVWGDRVSGKDSEGFGNQRGRNYGLFMVQGLLPPMVQRFSIFMLAWREQATNATKLTVGISALLLGYHIAAWWSPSHWLPLRFPVDNWYLVVGGLTFACVASVLMDKRQSQEEKP